MSIEIQRSYEDMTEERKWNLYVPPPRESDWPTMSRVVAEHPELCSEEQCWVLESLIVAAHKKRSEENEANN